MERRGFVVNGNVFWLLAIRVLIFVVFCVSVFAAAAASANAVAATGSVTRGRQVYAAVLELCLRTVRTSLTAGRNKEDLLTQWYTALPPQAIVGPGSRKLHLGTLKYLVQVHIFSFSGLFFLYLRTFCHHRCYPNGTLLVFGFEWVTRVYFLCFLFFSS